MTNVGIWESLIVSVVAATAAHWRGFLTIPAAVTAAMIGGIVLFLGGLDWGACMGGSFLATSLLSRRRDRIEQNDSSTLNARRNLQQVLANGTLLAMLAIAYGANDRESAGMVAAFLGCVGAVAGDTWATAVAGFAAKEPRLITSGKRVPAGTPGAVSGMGIALSGAAGVFASALYFAVSMFMGSETMSVTLITTLCCAAIIGALVGSLFDSFLGAACQARYIDPIGQMTDDPVFKDGRSNKYVGGWRLLSNDLVNFGNSIAGATSAYMIWLAAGLLMID